MLEHELAQLHSPTVFCHNDLLHKNIIVNDSKGIFYNIKWRAIFVLTFELDEVYFIDYEYASYNPRGYDIGNHFNEYAGMRKYVANPSNIVILLYVYYRFWAGLLIVPKQRNSI